MAHWIHILNRRCDMNVIEQRINEYLDAVEQVCGPNVRQQTVIEERGGSHVFIKGPDDEFGQLISVGHLEIMAENLRVH